MNESRRAGTVPRALAAIAAGWLTVVAAAQEPPDGDDARFGQPTLEQLRDARDALIVAADYQAALDPAEKVVATFDADDVAASDDLLRLALVQAELGDFDAAELNYTRVIELLAELDGEFSPTLIEPHRALGRAYIAGRRFAEAVVVLEQAQHISQRNDGLFNVEQTPIIDDITLAHLGLGNTIEARNLQVQRLENAIRRFGADDARVIPYHAALGEYYDRSRLKLGAKEQFQKAVEIGSAELGESDPSVVAALRRVAEIDLALGHETAARDRLEALLAEHADIEPTETGLALAVLGDWALAAGDLATAEAHYSRAFELVEAAGTMDPATYFGTPRALDFVPPLSPVDRAERNRPWTWGTIELTFNVSADGRPRNVDTLTMNPPDRMESDYVRRLRETHFRPRLVGGSPVAVENARFTHNFRYYVND